MKRLLICLAMLCGHCIMHAQAVNLPPYATEHLNGNVAYYEECTFNLWNLRLTSESGQTVQAIKRPESIVCHEFDEYGNETVTTRYVQRDANVGSVGMDDEGNIDFQANEISRDVPDTRTLQFYDENKLVTRCVWSFNAGDSVITESDSCIYDPTGLWSDIIMMRDSAVLTGRLQKQGRTGWNIITDDGKTREYRFDSERNLIRYTDRDGMTTRYTYNERGHIIKQLSEWKDGSELNVIFEDFEYDENGNWTRCTRKVKDPGEPPRSVKIIERSYIYR